jgi:dolichol-phosphate mannosyltransferase
MPSPADTPEPLLSLVIPTYNERDNIAEILRAAIAALGTTFVYEIIVADDDSPDRTWEVVEEIRADAPMVRLLRRTQGAKDQAHAVVEAFQIARGAILGKMDADGSHDPRALLAMVAKIEAGYEVAVGSRYARGGAIVSWPLPRRILSTASTAMVRTLMQLDIEDPLSGFWVMRREIFARAAQHPISGGFKVLLQLCVRGGAHKIAEVPIQFRDRTRGKTKLRPSVLLRSLISLLRLATEAFNMNRIVPHE